MPTTIAAAGDLVNFGRGLDRCGEILRRAPAAFTCFKKSTNRRPRSPACAENSACAIFTSSMNSGAAYRVAGLGYSNPTPFHTPGEYSEVDLARRLDGFAGLTPLLLVWHYPAYETALDRVRDGLHAGSTAVRDFLVREQPECFFCGHIHEAAGVSIEIGKTRARDVGKHGYLLELD